LGPPPLAQVRRAEAASAYARQRMVLELVQRDAPEVVAVRPDREEVRAARLGLRQVLERDPLAVEEGAGAVDGDEEARRRDQRRDDESGERRTARDTVRAGRELDPPVRDRVGEPEQDGERRESERDRPRVPDRADEAGA